MNKIQRKRERENERENIWVPESSPRDLCRTMSLHLRVLNSFLTKFFFRFLRLIPSLFSTRFYTRVHLRPKSKWGTPRGLVFNMVLQSGCKTVPTVGTQSISNNPNPRIGGSLRPRRNRFP